MRTLLIIPSIIAMVDASHDAKDVKTVSVGLAALAKAAKAFDSVDESSKRQVFASIASVARVTYDDTERIAGTYASKGSVLREALKMLRKATVLRVMSASVAHDAADDAASIVTIDKMVSNLDTIAKHLSSLTRSEPASVESAAG